MNQSRMKFTLTVMKWIQTFRQQRQSDKVIKMKINKEIKKNDFDEQQIKNTFINTQIILKQEIAESDKQKMKSFQQSQTLNMTNLLMQMLQNQQQQMDQMMTIFMNFVHTSSPTFTPSAALITHITPVSSSSMNNDLSYIKFPDLSLFNSNCNKYLA